MRNCREMRGEARKIITRNGWFWRLMMVSIVFQLISSMVTRLLDTAFAKSGIQTWDKFFMMKMSAMQGGMELAVPSKKIALNMTAASSFQMFIVYIFTAIAVFGVAVVVMKALRNDSDRWLGESLRGFGKPLELAWLMALINLKVMLWSLLFVIPGFIAIYRYRQAWFIKVENPDWSASKCIAESCKTMDGYKTKAFVFDLSYCGWLALAIIAATAMAVALVIGEEGGSILVSGVISLPSVMLLVYIFWLYMAGRVVFYKEITDNISKIAKNML